MDDKLLNYYEQELTFIREIGADFARKYPKIAGRLQLEPDKCEDPFTERLIEAFAFICARIHKKIDDDFPEITESLLSIIYPHYLNPIPSMSIVKFEPIKQNISESGYTIESDSALYSKPVDGSPCQFTTCYPVRIWPIEVVSASVRDPKNLIKDAQQSILIQLKTYNNINFSQLDFSKPDRNMLRFFLNGQSQHVFHLYELLFNNVCHIEIESTDSKGQIATFPLSQGDIKAVGFNPGESMFPYSRQSFPGYRLLFEYFCFPEKFLFFDLNGLSRIKKMDFSDSLDIRIYLNKPLKTDIVIDKNTFCLNVTPVSNLFKRIAEPVRVEHKKSIYRIIPDIRRQKTTEIYSIDKVSASTLSSQGEVFEYKPFYSIRHHIDEDHKQKNNVFWHIQRKASNKKDDHGTEVYLSFADTNFNIKNPEVEILTIHVTCTNRDLPPKLSFGDPSGDFNMEIAAPVARINCLIKPTPSRRPFMGGNLQWRLISHLSLNYMSVVNGGENALKEMLKLYDFDNSPATRQQINGIASLKTKHVTKRIGWSFCRGVEVTIEFDQDKYVGTGLYLFASILEKFLGQYVSVNSFSQLIATTIQEKEALKKWAPRNGERILL